jgi:hypothetical protein
MSNRFSVVCKEVEGKYCAIFNSREEWWTGDGWTADPKERQLYSSYEAARREFEKHESDAFKGVPYREFEATVKIRVYAKNNEYSLDELIEYLQKAIQLEILYDEHGAGPVEDDCKTDVTINWFDLKEKD